MLSHSKDTATTCGDTRLQARPRAFLHQFPDPPERNPSQFKQESGGRCLLTVVVFIRHENDFFYT